VDEDSYSESFDEMSSSNQLPKMGEAKKEEVFSADAMNEYMKKQQMPQLAKIDTTAAVRGQPSESSDRYDDDEFESISKSQIGISSSQLQSSERAPAPQKTTPSIPQKSVVSAYIQKDNKAVMTDLGKYSFMEETSYKEWTL